MLIYLLKSTACMALFLLFYKLLLEKENMHIFKRCYLMLALAASFVIPGLVFIEYVEPVVLTTYSNTNTFIQTSNPIITETAARDIDVINWSLIAWSIYSLGVVVFGVRFLRNLFQILNRIRKNPKLKERFSIKVLLVEQLPPHTFFKYIFLNKEKFEANTIPKEVLLHEEIHAKQRHSIDVIFIEFLQVVLWFNPLIFFFKKCIKLNHEFLADSAVIKKTISPSNYQNTLLSYLSQDSLEKYQSVKMANAINYSSIKKRFKVMKTHTSKKAILLRSLLLLPLLAMMLYGFSETKIIERTNPDIENHIKEELDKVNKLQVNYYLEEASEKMMLEYEQFILDYEKTNTIEYASYQRVIAIYDLMTEAQRKSVKKYPEFRALNKINSVKTKLLEKEKLEAYKNKENYAIWIDGKVVDNKQLNEFEASDFVYHSESFVYKNARSNRFPQEYQVSLYTKKGFENTFKKEGLKSVDLAKFNVLAEKYNAISIEKRVIPLEDLKILESIYRKMSIEQKENAQSFPECLPKNIQKGASREQMKTYNALAKKYNEMSRDDMRILMKDVEQLKYIYSLMSDKQKADAEPFPDFPEPPPAPKAINNPSAPLPSSESPKVVNGQATTIPQPPSPKVIKGQASTIPSPPSPPIPPSPLDHVIDMAKKGATFYYEGKKISSDKAIELIKKNKSLNISTKKSSSKNPQVRISKEPIKIGKATKKENELLEYAIELEKKNANFYIDNKYIDSKKALSIIANKVYNRVETFPYTSKTPEVRIYTKPLTQKKSSGINLETGNIKVNGKELFYSTKNGVTSYFDKEGEQVDRQGILLSKEQKQNPTFYFNGEKITSAKAHELLKNNKSIQVATEDYTEDEYAIVLTDLSKASYQNHNKNNNPNSVIDLTEMIEKEASFFYNDEPISIEKALWLTKNDYIERVQTIGSKNGKPKVYFWKKV